MCEGGEREGLLFQRERVYISATGNRRLSRDDFLRRRGRARVTASDYGSGVSNDRVLAVFSILLDRDAALFTLRHLD